MPSCVLRMASIRGVRPNLRRVFGRGGGGKEVEVFGEREEVGKNQGQLKRRKTTTKESEEREAALHPPTHPPTHTHTHTTKPVHSVHGGALLQEEAHGLRVTLGAREVQCRSHVVVRTVKRQAALLCADTQAPHSHTAADTDTQRKQVSVMSWCFERARGTTGGGCSPAAIGAGPCCPLLLHCTAAPAKSSAEGQRATCQACHGCASAEQQA